MAAYYNEFDPGAAAWLRELIKAGEIADGFVDERSIVDVRPEDLRGFTQCHFFAGIGGWSRALRLAGVCDDTPIWSGSAPCQPFSNAGSQGGFYDPRHPWPHLLRLIQACLPDRVVGEQVANSAALGWWDVVCDDLEESGYTGWAADLCSAGVGAAHIRQRLYWVADSNLLEREGSERGGERADAQRPASARDGEAGPVQWLLCRDGKQRPVEPGTQPLVAKLPRGVVPSSRIGLAFDANNTAEARTIRLKGYGNAIDPELAAQFLRAIDISTRKD